MPVTILKIPAEQEVTLLKSVSHLVYVVILELWEGQVPVHLRQLVQVQYKSEGVRLFGNYFQWADNLGFPPF